MRIEDTYTFTDILAKSDPEETLAVHTHNAITYLKQVIRWHSRNISYACGLLDISYDEIVARLFAMVYLHDLGKSNPSFQKYIRKKEERPFPPHALMSAAFVVTSAPPLKIGRTDLYPETLAVMSHHTPYYGDLYSECCSDADPETQFNIHGSDGTLCKNYCLNFYRYLPSVYAYHFGKEYPFVIPSPNLGRKFNWILSKVKKTLLRDDRPKHQLRYLHALFVSVLHYSDWLSSGRSSYRYSEELIAPRLELYAKMDPYFDDWYDFQTQAADVKGNMLLCAPTGKGKTEAALWWAHANLKAGKILYLLPTRVTANAMYDRLTRVLGHTTGISHGTVVLRIAEDEKWNYPEILAKRLIYGTFMSPTTVATVDQLLLSLFNWRHWEMIEQNASNAVIIFDEIHAYDFYTMALISQIIGSLSGLGSKFAFLSATFPKYLKEYLLDILDNPNPPVIDKQFNQLVRHKIHFFAMDIINAIDDIISQYQKGEKVLVILNTVDSAIEYYNEIKTFLISHHEDTANLVLYHSRFIERDREKKETIIKKAPENNNGFIAVTTQVVEVSLNIDYDILFTQVAPLDALVQRFGRINRKGGKIIPDTGNIMIYNFGSTDQWVYGEANLVRAKEIVKAELDKKSPSEESILPLADKQYPIENSLAELKKEKKNVNTDLNMLRNELWEIQSLLLGDRDNALYRIARSRREKAPDIQIIPSIYENEISNEKYAIKAGYYVVRVPLYKFEKCIRYESANTFIPFADIDYSTELGATRCL